MKTAPYHITALSFIIIMFFAMLAWGIIDSQLYLDKWYDHAWRFAVRAGVIAAFCYSSLMQGQLRSMISAITLGIVFGAVWWIGFDVIHNISKGFDWSYLGDTALLDRIFPNIYYQLGTKALLLIAGAFWHVREEMK